MIQTVQGVVLRVEETGDYDQKLTLYTKEFGKFKVNVVGARKSISKLRGLAIPFSEARFQVYLHGTIRAGVNDPGKLIGGETLASHEGLRSVWERMLEASIFAETLDCLTQTFFPNEPEYALLVQSLKNLEENVHPVLTRLRSTLILLKILGYSLRHHPTWKSLSNEDRSLMVRLGAWTGEENLFPAQDISRLEAIIQPYLSLFLPVPLKSELFLRKVSAGLA